MMDIDALRCPVSYYLHIIGQCPITYRYYILPTEIHVLTAASIHLILSKRGNCGAGKSSQTSLVCVTVPGWFKRIVSKSAFSVRRVGRWWNSFVGFPDIKSALKLHYITFTLINVQFFFNSNFLCYHIYRQAFFSYKRLLMCSPLYVMFSSCCCTPCMQSVDVCLHNDSWFSCSGGFEIMGKAWR